jgi:MerR family transcriptional regulator, thiopeptide resistance regulator
MALKVGELAKQSRISVRTLHHYDKIGLVIPSLRNEAGHRLYADADITRLQSVILLRSLAFSLEDIRKFLNNPATSPVPLLEMHTNL